MLAFFEPETEPGSKAVKTFSTSFCGRRHYNNALIQMDGQIQIFPLRGATSPGGCYCPDRRISTHAPLAGCDFLPQIEIGYLIGFQLTHPSRGATKAALTAAPIPVHFNSRTPRGVRRYIPYYLLLNHKISTHAPLAGCDTPFLT